ncbi:MAG: hypothetical protein Kow0013_10360 [Pararhodobacter sp.]
MVGPANSDCLETARQMAPVPAPGRFAVRGLADPGRAALCRDHLFEPDRRADEAQRRLMALAQET